MMQFKFAPQQQDSKIYQIQEICTYTRHDMQVLKEMYSKNASKNGKKGKENELEYSVSVNARTREASEKRSSRASLPGHEKKKSGNALIPKTYSVLLPLFLCHLESGAGSFSLAKSDVKYCSKLTNVFPGETHPTL